MNYTKEQVIELVNKDGHNLKHLPEHFRNDREVVDIALNENMFAIKHISSGLKNNYEFIEELIKNESQGIYVKTIYENMSENLKQDKHLTIFALRKEPQLYKDLPMNLKKDRDIIVCVLQTDGMELKNVPGKLRNDKELVYIAQTNCTNATKYTDKETRNYFEKREYLDDENFIKTAIKVDIDNSWRMSDRLKDNEDIAKFILKEIKENEHIYNYYKDSPRLDIFTSERLRNNKEFMLQAVIENNSNINYASTEIQELCKGQSPVEALTKLIATEKLHAELQKDLSKPNESSLDFARKLSAECKEHVQTKEQSMEQSKPRAKMKI